MASEMVLRSASFLAAHKAQLCQKNLQNRHIPLQIVPIGFL
ncbi:MAG: hypothetical protein ACI4NU_02290 [Christensenellales bacterium]